MCVCAYTRISTLGKSFHSMSGQHVLSGLQVLNSGGCRSIKGRRGNSHIERELREPMRAADRVESVGEKLNFCVLYVVNVLV